MSRVWTKVLLLLPVVGVVLTLIGVDAICCLPAPWWERTGFVVNLASGLTAACFGIPVAFFGIQKLIRDGEQDRSRRNLKRQTLRSLQLMQHDAKETFGSDDTTLQDVSRKAKRIGALLLQLEQGINGSRVVSAERFHEASESLTKLIADVETFHIFHFPGSTDAAWSRLVRTWKLLEGRLLIDAAVEELYPLPPHMITDIDSYIATFGDDFAPFWEVSPGRSLWNLNEWFDRIAGDEREYSTGDGRLRIPTETPGLDLAPSVRR